MEKIKKQGRMQLFFRWCKRVLLVLGILTPMVLYYVVVPCWRLHSPKWMKSATQAQKLEVLHKVLAAPLGPMHHDAFLIATEIGTQETVPYLISALRWQGHHGPDNDVMVCTKSHCLEALRKLTKHDVGLNHSDWAKWYKRP